jgi:hypothetical protein
MQDTAGSLGARVSLNASGALHHGHGMDIHPIAVVVAITIVFVVGYAFLYWFQNDDSYILRNRFAGLGDPVGRTSADIIAQVGRPTSTYRVGEQELYTWTKPTYEIALQFKAGQCTGIQHESRRD